MPLFHFHLRTDQGIDQDDDGTPFPDLDAAYLDVCRAIPDMVEGLLSDGYDPMRCAFEITDERGQTLMDVPFAERLTKPAPAPPLRSMANDLLSRAAAIGAETRALCRLMEQTRRIYAWSPGQNGIPILNFISRRYNLPAADADGVDIRPAMPGTVPGFRMPGAKEAPTL